MTNKRIVWLALLIGTVVPVIILTVDYLSPQGWWPNWIFFLWPASFMLGAVVGTWDSATYLVIGIAILLNAILYGVAGALVVGLRRLTQSTN